MLRLGRAGFFNYRYVKFLARSCREKKVPLNNRCRVRWEEPRLNPIIGWTLFAAFLPHDPL